MMLDKKTLDRQLQDLIAELDRGQDEATLAREVLDRLTPELHEALLHRLAEELVQEVLDEQIAAGRYIDHGDGTISKAV